MVWDSHIGLKQKKLDISKTIQRKKFETWHMLSTPCGAYMVKIMSSVKWYSRHNWLNQNPYQKYLKLHISDLRPDASEEFNL